ncbi:cysteine desulfurase [Sphingobium vermicomposti]|uniref:Cysteine desulfurase n=1 Tax=Sphingobium vermicomposti TaxID=529005 RepID=A0A846M5T5_9SPHN|nr:cysteine desulfurase [Sphingobium vermicomposti]
MDAGAQAFAGVARQTAYIEVTAVSAINEYSRLVAADRLYLDHAATTPMLAEAKAAMVEALDRWANPSSPHADGRAARAVLEDARGRIAQALGWQAHVIFTSGATEAIAMALGHAPTDTIATSPVEHDSVLRVTPGVHRLPVDRNGRVDMTLPAGRPRVIAVQHVNNETGVIQPLDEVERTGALIFADCAQSAGKLPLPDADMVAISAHKFGGPPGTGALLVKDLALLRPSGGQEQGYRAGTENLPGILGMMAALEGRRDWLPGAEHLRARLDRGIEAAGGEVVAKDASRIAAIASYRMPGVSARAQLIQFDMAGISVSAGSACSSGSLKTGHVLHAMGWDDVAASEVVRVSFGPTTDDADVDRFLRHWSSMAEHGRR